MKYVQVNVNQVLGRGPQDGDQSHLFTFAVDKIDCLKETHDTFMVTVRGGFVLMFRGEDAKKMSAYLSRELAVEKLDVSCDRS